MSNLKLIESFSATIDGCDDYYQCEKCFESFTKDYMTIKLVEGSLGDFDLVCKTCKGA